MSQPRNHSADTCETMADVRYEIDRLDQVLVEILAERVGYMNAAARIKGSRDLVRDEARIEDVVSKVLKAANSSGLPASVAEPVWRTLIERCIDYELEAFDALKSSNNAK